MDNQISMFEMLGMDETPVIPFEEQKKGTKGYCIRIAALYTIENGFPKNQIGVTVRKMELVRDSKTDSHGRWQYARSIDHCKGDGWWGSPEKLYARRPTWKECEDYVRARHRGEPREYEVVYLRKNGDATYSICDYESDN